MIKREDLRIGNMVYKYNKYDTEDQVGIVGYGDMAFNDILSPIPLTEKWMLEFGFEKHEKNHGAPIGGNYTDFYLDGYVFNQDVSGTWFLSGYNWNTKHFSCVHELQNLFFALSGYELSLKN